jgi:8-oxo-dGTP pyrophosphatase MutT (NUDIX family)
MNITERVRLISFYRSLTDDDFSLCRSSASLFIPDGRLMDVPEGITPVKSGVMMMCYPEDDQLNLVFIKRTEDGRIHSGQIAFPGGRFDSDSDNNTLDTAIRETEEEVGIMLSRDDVLCRLSPLFIPPSGFLVDPYLIFLNQKPVLKASPDEVAGILYVPFDCFLSKQTIQQSEFSTIRGVVKAPCWVWNDIRIWGATAIILSELGCLERRRREALL